MIIETNETTAAPPVRRSFERLLATLYRPIADDLIAAEQILRAELRSRVDFVTELTDRVRLYEGKRVRPALLLLVASACGRVKPAHHTLAAVVEMIHAATLVHDDVLDDAEVRRHVATVNAEWGAEASILLGDFLFTHSFHLAASLDSAHACRRIGQSTNRVCEGELNQVARRGQFDLSEAEYLSIIDGKTAELIACSCELGASYADAPAEIVAAMEAFGRGLGRAFQIADDILDLVGDERLTGKTTGCDLAKQKMTLPLIRFRDVAPAADVERLRLAFEAAEPLARERVLEIIASSDALPYATARANACVADSLARLELLPDSPARQSLMMMARLSVDRPA